MTRLTKAAVSTLLAVVALALSGAAAADHPEGETDATVERNKHALHDFSHEAEGEGHIEQNVNYGFELVSKIAPAGVQTGLYTDVWAEGNYAYVGTFEEPDCTRAGVYVVDISDPENPSLATHVKSPPDTRVNDVKTIELDTKHFKGTVLIHTLEPCGIVPGHGGQRGQGGISLYDVSNPTRPHVLFSKFLDFGVHNTYPWVTEDGRAFLILVDDVHQIDTHIVEITKPQRPRLIASTGLPEWEGVEVDGHGDDALLHDVWVDKIGDEYIAVLSYWDAGFIKLNVTDPSNPEFLGDSNYPDPDPITGATPPEGNAHAAVFSADGSKIYAGDEDFAPHRVTFEITSGPNAGEYPGAEGAFTRPIVELADQAMNGPTKYLGLGCDPSDTSLPGAVEDGDPLTDEIAVFQRGACFFETKAETAVALGYDGFIVFNDEARGDTLISMAGVEPPFPDIPGIFVGHSTGLAIFDVESVAELAIGANGATVAATAEFDGWGYFHGLATSTLDEIGYYAPQEVANPAFATDHGDLTMHNVEGDPDLAEADRAYIAWYSLGMRAIEYAPGFSITSPGRTPEDAGDLPATDYYASNFREVGRFIAPEGSNFWGVHVHEHPNGQEYVLGSDRNSGLWIFSFGG